MVKIQSFPYLRPAQQQVEVTKWQQIGDEETDEAFPESLPHWDPGMAIEVSATVRLNIAQIWQECLLADKDQLRLILLWDSLGTGLRGKGSAITLSKSYPLHTVEVQAKVDGSQLANQIKFTVQLILANSGKSISKLAPHIAGSILWQADRTLHLEGQGPRFPMEFLNFADTSNSLPAGAGWYLEWHPDAFEESFMGRVRLFLNADNKLIARSVKGNTQEDALLQGMIRFDIGKTMIVTALANDSFLENYRSYEDGSVGATIRNMLNTYFPGEDIEGLANSYRNSSARFECALQEHFQLFQFTEER